jgi:hypothetical protein
MSLGKLTMPHYSMNGQMQKYVMRTEVGVINTMSTNQLGIMMENTALAGVGLLLLRYCQQVKYQTTTN